MKSFYKTLLTATLLSPVFSFAQSNFKPGFVINLKGDTLKGYIDLKEWGNNPKSINFKTALDKPAPQTFTVADIKYFGIPKITAYKSFTTSISLDETNIQRITGDLDTSSKTDNVFLKVLQPGKNVTLYGYEDDLKKRYYIYDSQTGNIAELIYRIYVDKNSGTRAAISKNAYRQQLLLIAQKFETYNDNFRNNIEEADYQESDLVSICRKINNTQKEDIINSNRKYVSFFCRSRSSIWQYQTRTNSHNF